MSGFEIATDLTRSFHRMASGFGASWHAVERAPGGRAGSAFGGNPPIERADLWNQLEAHADWMGLSFIRAEFCRASYEPERRGAYTFDSPDVRALERILRWAGRAKADVMLQQQWEGVAHNAFPEYRDDPTLITKSAPYNLSSFVEGIMALVRHLRARRLLRPVKFLCITNEPYGWWKVPPNAHPDARRRFARALAMTRSALKAIAPQIRLIGPDFHGLDRRGLVGGELDYPGPLAREPWGRHVDAYDMHCYCSTFDWEGDLEDSAVREKLFPMAQNLQGTARWAADAHHSGKPFLISELGCFSYGCHGAHPGPGFWKSNLKNAQFIIRALNVGVDGFSRWSFTNRGDVDGQWQMVDTMSFTSIERPPRPLEQVTPHQPTYAAHALITRHCGKNSRLYPVSVSAKCWPAGIARVHAAVLRDPAGEVTALITNDDTAPWRGVLKVKAPKSVRVASLKEHQLCDPNILRLFNPNVSMMLPTETGREHGLRDDIRLNLPPKSMVALSSRDGGSSRSPDA